MKRIILILAALAAWTAAAATPNRTATEAYVTNKIAAAVAALPAPDYSTNNTELVETIQTTAPAPDLSGYLPKSGGTLTGSLHIKTGANEMLDLYNDDPYLFGRVTVDWLTHEDGPSTLSLWDRFRNIHYDFPTNGGTVAMLENFPTKVSAFLNDAGYLTSAPVTKVNGKTGNVTLSATDVSAIPTTGGVFSVSTMHFAPRLSVGPWNASIRPYDISGGSGAAFVFGDNLQTKKSNTMTLGVGVLNTNEWSFIWNGDANRMYVPTVPSMSNPYATRYNGGFHVNPSVRFGMVNPLQNFWIGDTNLNDWISALAPTPTWDTLSGKPTFATVATSGAYSDLSGKPTIPTTAADVGALSTNGGTLNGGITVWGDSTFYCNTFSFSDTFKIKFMDAVMTPYLEIFGNTINLPFQSGTLALTSDIPTSMAWGAITSKPTTLSGYGITDALKADFSTLTNNAAFTSAVAAVSPPVDLSGYCTTGEAAGIASNVVSQAYIRQKLGVYLYVGEDGGIYVHTEE